MTNRNVLPIQTPVRVRKSTHIVNVQDESSGAIPVELDEESRVTVRTVGLSAGCPAIVAVKVGGVPTVENWDVLLVLRDIVQQPVLASIGLPAGEHTLNWASFDEFMAPMAFPEGNMGIMLAIVDV